MSRDFKLKQGIEQLANSLKNINKTVGMFTYQSKRLLQGNGMAAISKTGQKLACHVDRITSVLQNDFAVCIELIIFGKNLLGLHQNVLQFGQFVVVVK